MLKINGRIALAVVLSSALVVAGCSKAEEKNTASDTSSSSAVTTAKSSEAKESATTEAEKDSADKAGFPVEVKNCGVEVDMKAEPTRIVTVNQGATELLLALGAQDQMVGTAYLDDEIDSSVADAYAAIPVLAEKYPSKEALLEVKPDFVVASFASAFKPEKLGTREELAKLGINTYLDPFACPDKAQKAPAKWESIYGQIDDMGKLIGKADNAKKVVGGITTKVDKFKTDMPGKDKTVFWYDSSTETPFVGAGDGGPQLILDTVGATNIFADLPGNWADGSWETVLETNPDYIVLADASWDTAESKKEYLKSNESLKDLDAVKNDRFIVVPFGESVPGVHTIDGVEKVAEGLK